MRVPTVDGDQPFVNLDNAASTPAFEPIWGAVRQAWRQPVDVQQDLIHDVRSVVAEAVGAPPSEYDVIFTANTTDAINLVAEGEGRASAQGIQPVVINTLLEHNSNELPWRAVPGATLLRLPMDGEGFLDLRQLEAWLRARECTPGSPAGAPSARPLSLAAHGDQRQVVVRRVVRPRRRIEEGRSAERDRAKDPKPGQDPAGQSHGSLPVPA